ncbi:hypothetical protein NKI04_32645 [Mesorhizobium sp. M0814]|uniref:hypothetical protein n=1 Tax=Mesorhizobium sp. M0814 TaxID=2957004 RepID=UPI003337A83E
MKHQQPGRPARINTTSGPVLLDPAQTVDVDVSAAEQKVAKATGWFSFAGKNSSQSDEFLQGKGADTEREDLKKQADKLGIDYAKNIPTDKLKELVDAKLAE